VLHTLLLNALHLALIIANRHETQRERRFVFFGGVTFGNTRSLTVISRKWTTVWAQVREKTGPYLVGAAQRRIPLLSLQTDPCRASVFIDKPTWVSLSLSLSLSRSLSLALLSIRGPSHVLKSRSDNGCRGPAGLGEMTCGVLKHYWANSRQDRVRERVGVGALFLHLTQMLKSQCTVNILASIFTM